MQPLRAPPCWACDATPRRRLGLSPALPAALRMLRGLPQILNGGRFFDAEGNRVARPGEAYQANGVRVQVQK